MDSKFIPAEHEEKIYDFWEKNGYFEAKVIAGKKPFSIILPPPNANGNVHIGHAMFIYEDIMIRYHKLKGYETLWLLGLDHAGIETQFVYEKLLRKQGKSRYDFDRDTLYKMIWDFVQENKGTIKGQLKRLGFALDWSKEKFTLDPEIVSIIYKTFKDLFDKELVYRDMKLVNYCTRCGTSYSDYEVVYEERTDPLYYLKYGPFELATTRPETLFGDTGIAIHPSDKKYAKYIDQDIQIEGLNGPFTVKVVADKAVDPKFGTGVVKITPAHDVTDYEISQRHHLPMRQVIDFNGKLNDQTGIYKGLTVIEGRKKVAEDLEKKGLIVRIQEDYMHRVGTCYRCGRVIEPLPKEQWFVKIKPLAKDAIALIEKNEISFFPKKYKKQAVQILNNYIDWNISRQNVWGMRIPAYHCKSTNKWFVSVTKPDTCQLCDKNDFVQDEDIFDTWFSSSQWPFATLQNQGKEMFDYFYPTSMMETGYDILRPWVLRMIMIGFFETKQIPFKEIFLHGMVRDKKGLKMSKSKGNVIDPIEKVDLYGADAFRSSLIFGTKEGGDISLSDERITGMRNFTNKIWNIGRFIEMSEVAPTDATNKSDQILKELHKEFSSLQKKYSKQMDSYKFSAAFGDVYEFLWHRFADIYIEQLKDDIKSGNMRAYTDLKDCYLQILIMLHPFMPFVTEAVWKVFKGENTSILDANF